MNLSSNNVFIVDGVRTPIGRFMGALGGFPATHLSGVVVKELMKRNNLAPEVIDELFWGNVCSANLGQSPARQVVFAGGLSEKVPATIVNKVCSSSLKAISLAAGTIALGSNEMTLAGGMENMSQVPRYLANSRKGFRLGDDQIIDGLMKDGLSDAYQGVAMGVFADKTADKHGISRQAQDDWAKVSYQRAKEATARGIFHKEIVPWKYQDKKGREIAILEDEEIEKGNFAKAPNLKPVFTPDGTVTAFNASKINDGAAGVILASEKKIQELNLTKRVRIIASIDFAKDPQWFTTAPIEATKKALATAELALSDIDFIEINEAFAVVPLVFMKELSLAPEKVNVHGGAIALGHPIGASGGRILVSLMNVLSERRAKLGLAVICNGGGGASAMVIENCLEN